MLGRKVLFIAIFGIASLVVVTLMAQSNQTGITYSARMEKLGKRSTFYVWATDKKAKFLVSTSDDPGMPAGISIIALDRGERYVLLLDQKRTFFEMTKDQFRKFEAREAATNEIEIRHSQLEELVVNGDGDLIAGNKTRYFKLRFSLDATEEGRRVAVQAVEEFWTAPTVEDPAPSLDLLTHQISGIGQIDALLDYKKLNGYPLKRIVQVFENGQFVGRSLVEIIKISRTPIDESVFEVPSDYKKMDIPTPKPTDGR